VSAALPRLAAIAVALLLGACPGPGPGVDPDGGVDGRPGELSPAFRACLGEHDVSLAPVAALADVAAQVAIAKVACAPADADLLAYGERVGADLR